MMERPPAFIIALAAIIIALPACAAAPTPEAPRASAPPLDQLELHDLELPPMYLRLTEDESALEERRADWALAISGEPTISTCGDQLKWVWLANAPSGSRVGDPAVRLFICTTPSVADASGVLESVPIEETLLPRLDGIYEASFIDIGPLELRADEASIACVWGDPEEGCRAWAYAGGYDRYVVFASFVLAGIGGDLDQEAFFALVESIDSAITDWTRAE